ncbi:MAG: glycoside hydrolase family 127 protein [Clostridia bacterium]|nr:glycoside hydrolase family 127 protein [Clostridia bacterium]
MRTQQNVPLSAVRVEDGFWSNIQTLVRDVVLPYQADILEDKSVVTEKSHAVENFRIAAREAEGEFQGMVFQDSDVAKWLEAASYALALQPDEALNAHIDEIIRLIDKAQQADGYVNTYFTVKAPDKKWTNLRDNHELYCLGHMIEAGVAHTLATNKHNLLDIVCRAADMVCRRFGPGKTRGVPGHEEIELALLRLYRVTGKQDYLDTARYFIEERGKQPSFFEEERARHAYDLRATNEEYHQSHLPVREQTEAVGHSVRAMYLYAAMADLSAETGDASLYEACRALLDNILESKMYVTGGLGSTFHGEAFTPAYDLPNDTAYAETCASIGMCFFARRMLEIKPEGRVADLLERQLFNNILAGIQLDGTRFFYVNPLEVIPSISGAAPAHKHVQPQRPGWHACACCPPNLSRLILSLGRYAWGSGDRTIYAHLWLGGSAQFSVAGRVDVACESQYPWNGAVCYTISPAMEGARFCLAIHLPSCCRNAYWLLNGEVFEPDMKDGYAYIDRAWHKGDTVKIISELPVLRLYSNLAVPRNAGLTCLQRGPVIFCLEECDNSAPLAALRLPPDAEIGVEKIHDGALKGMTALTWEGVREISDTGLYSERHPIAYPAKVKAIPYFAWGNREAGEMRVWVRE